MKRCIFSIVFLLVLGLCLSAEERIVVNTGHTAPILDIAFRDKANGLFTTGEDGTVRRWDTVSGRLVKKLQISHLPIVKLAVHPDRPLIALIETDRINTYHLSVWDYRSEKELYSHKISEVPLFLRFSPKGSYLVYGLTDWESLTFLESETGYQRRLFEEGFGIVSAAFISETERTLLTYSPSGEIRYWDLESGEQKALDRRINTVKSLEDISFLPGGRYLVGKRGGELYMSDLFSGRVVDSRDFSNILDVSMGVDGESLLVLYDTGPYPQLSLLSVSTSSDTGALGFEDAMLLSLEENARGPVAWNGERAFFTGEDGALFAKTEAEETSLFAAPILLDIQDIAFSDKNLYISAGDRFLSINSRAFTSMQPDEEVRSYRFNSELYTNPLGGKTGLISLEDEGCLIFPMGEQKGPLSIYRFTEGRFTPFYAKVENPVLTGSSYGEDLLLLESNGTIKIIDAENGEENFTYSSFGLRSVSEVYNGRIISARNRTDLISTPLLHINPDTGETVPIDDSNILTFYLEYDEMTRNLYTLGYEERSGGLRTVLKQHSGFNYDRVTTLISYPGEDPEASLVVDPESSRVFTSLGYGKVHMYAWNGFTYLEKINHIPRRLYVNEGFLYSLNGDSSISVWDTDTGTLLMTIFIFEDYSWAVVPKKGRPYSYGSARRYLHTVE